MTLTRRRLLAFAPLPLALLAGAPATSGLPVDGAALAGCVSSWRTSPVAWDDALAAEAGAWAAALAERGAELRHAFAVGYDAAGVVVVGECLAAGLPTWPEAFEAWVSSDRHLAVMRDAAFTTVGMAGAERLGSRHRWYWCLRLQGAS